jgi:hypothetical protein
LFRHDLIHGHCAQFPILQRQKADRHARTVLRGRSSHVFTEATMTERTLPPPCPNCAGKTAFKEMHRLSKGDGFMCFFRCAPCELEYPLALASTDLALAGLQVAARKLSGTGPRE